MDNKKLQAEKAVELLNKMIMELEKVTDALKKGMVQVLAETKEKSAESKAQSEKLTLEEEVSYYSGFSQQPNKLNANKPEFPEQEPGSDIVCGSIGEDYIVRENWLLEEGN